MTISSKHPDYFANYGKWERCRDAFEGTDAIKFKGNKYLPKLSKQSVKQYNAYKDRALFYSITSKTISALTGMAMVRQPIVKLPAGMDYHFKDDDQVQFMENLNGMLNEDLLMGRVGFTIDRPLNGGEPYVCFYSAENIINWKIKNDTSGLLDWVILTEYIDVQKGDDKYEMIKQIQYRELFLDSDGHFAVQLYNVKEEPIGGKLVPNISGKPYIYIPFWIVNPQGLGMEVSKPPVLDIVDINISHYRSSADLEHGRHFTALPTPYITGATKGLDLMIGSETAWIIPEAAATVGFLEFTGQGLQSLEKALAEKQAQLASLSARLLDNSKKGSEAAETVRLRYVSETASLAGVVRAVEAAMIIIYREIAIAKELNPNEVSIELNKEFLNPRMKSADVVDLINSFLSDGISADTLVYNLRRGDVIPVEADDAIEVARLEQSKAAIKAANAATLAASAKNRQPQNQPPK